MDPLEILKKFKNIEPDPNYTRKSRMLILASPENIKQKSDWVKILKAVFGNKLAPTFSLVATVVVVILINALFDFSDNRLAGLDPIGMQAEARAIDIQIKLTNLVYENPSLTIKSTIIKTSTTATTILKTDSEKILELLSSEDKKIEDLENSLKGQDFDSSSSTNARMDVDGALEKLAE